ncbi:CopD family protein [Massilia sp. PAMC28688]|uniref:copper resistance D family protein n=1 Tax=Massilia sp. PAMC28688 TaxID=2861283 RepID=UPI001C625D77|nr:CopD family protein [Massilia sp. PAMC28688]QYF93070.1 CopD family protein [Massilia sp. PAMC28688]
MVLDVQLAIYSSTVVLNLALAVAVGAAMAAMWLASGATPWSLAQLRRARPVRIGAAMAALAAMGSLLPFVSAFMAEVPVAEAGDAMGAMLTDSHFGLAWRVGMGALLAAALAAAVPVSGQRLRNLALVNLLVLAVALYSRSMVSHAAADGDLSVAIVLDWMHLCLISVWVGEVFIAGFVTLNGMVPDYAAGRAEAARYVEHLSSSATFALGGIFATGLFSAWHNLGGIAGLAGNVYGSVLLFKLALVVLAALLGGFNRFIVMPSLLASLREPNAGAPEALRRFRLILRIEAPVLLAVLVAAAILSATPPPTAA